MFGPVQALTLFFARAFDFKGRATRSEFWWAQLWVAIAVITATTRDLRASPTAFTEADPAPVAIGPVAQAFADLPLPHEYALFWVLIVITAPSLSLVVRRMHDVGYSGLWYLVAVVPGIGSLILLVLMLLPSAQIYNKWGRVRDPENPMAAGEHPGYAMVASITNWGAVQQAATEAHVREKVALAAASGEPETPQRKRSAFESYAVLNEIEEAHSPENIAARKAEIAEYYRLRVLAQKEAARKEGNLASTYAAE